MRRTLMAPVLALVLGTSALHAQDTLRAGGTSDTKSATTARLVGLFPGAGHLYAGETARGLGVMGGMLGVLAIGTLALTADCYSSFLSADDDCGSSGTANVVTAAFLGLWGWSIYDAGRAAHRTNAKRRLSVSVIVAPARVQALARETRGVRAGLSIRTR